MNNQSDPKKEIPQLSPFSGFVKKSKKKLDLSDKTFNKSIQKKIIEETEVEVNLPASIKIDLVQGNELRHYEIFFSIASFSLSTAVGFWTGYLSNEVKFPSTFWSALAFTIFACISFGVTLFFRSKLRDGTVKKVMTLNKFN